MCLNRTVALRMKSFFIMTRRLKDNAHTLRVLSKASPKQRKAILQYANNDLIKCLCECALNILKGTVPLTSAQKKKLQRHKNHLRALADKKTPLVKRKRVLVQKGGFLGSLIAPILSTLGGLLFSK